MSTLNVDTITPQSSPFTNVGVTSGLSVAMDIMGGTGSSLPSVGGIKIGGASGGIIQISNYSTLPSLGLGTVAIGGAVGQPTGMDNILVGRTAGQQLTTGIQNICIGALTGSNLTTGDNNIVIGRNAQASTATTSNSITLGNSSHTVIRAAVTTITSLSDARDKKDVKELGAGLDFVKGLKPVEFVWDDRNEEGKHDIKDFGFIAQDLKKSQEDAELADTLKLVYEENPEKLEASYGKLVPILVKAIQDLSAKVEALEAKKK